MAFHGDVVSDVSTTPSSVQRASSPSAGDVSSPMAEVCEPNVEMEW